MTWALRRDKGYIERGQLVQGLLWEVPYCDTIFRKRFSQRRQFLLRRHSKLTRR